MVSLQTERLRTVEQVRAFAEGSEPVDYKPKDRASAYAFVRRTVARFDYHRLGRAGRGCVRAYIGKAYGYSPAPVTRLIWQQAETGAVVDRRAGRARTATGSAISRRRCAETTSPPTYLDKAGGWVSPSHRKTTPQPDNKRVLDKLLEDLR